jgi:hypothetical protein
MPQAGSSLWKLHRPVSVCSGPSSG